MALLTLLLTIAASWVTPRPITPGVVRPLTAEAICHTAWGHDRRHVTIAMKKTVAAQYGVAWVDRAAYEFDHLIPRELGGDDVVANLWPQPWPSARQKDRLENRLRVLVCRGDLALADAQHAIATDWPGAFRRYVVAR